MKQQARKSSRRHQGLPWVRAVSAAATLGLLLAACGPVDDEEVAEADTEAEPDDEDGNGEVDDGDYDEDGILRVAWHVGPRHWDPHTQTSATPNPHFFAVFDRLIHLSPDGELIPGLAEDWEFSEDGLVLTLELREGVTFHDGEPFDAEAVAANVDRQMTHEDSGIAGELEGVDRVEVTDEFTIEYHLDKPNAALPGILSDRAGQMSSPAVFQADDFDLTTDRIQFEDAVGAGMYRVVDSREQDSITYEAYEDYWDEDAQRLAGMEWEILTDERTRINLLQTGGADVVLLRDGSMMDDAEAAGFTVDDTPRLEYDQIYMNRSIEPFSDENFRLAVNHALDRDALAEGLTQGWATAAHQPFPESYWAYNDEVGEYYDYDPELAEEYLAQADVEPAFTTIDFPGLTTSSLNEAVQAQLAEVGIDMEIMPVDPAGVGEAPWAIEGEVEGMTAEWTGRPDPSMTFALAAGEIVYNPGQHATEEAAEAYRRTLETIDEHEREQAVQDMGRVAAEQGLYIPLISKLSHLAYSEDVIGADESWVAGHEFRGIGLRR